MSKFPIYLLTLYLINVNLLSAYELAGDEIVIQEVLPLFNKYVEKKYIDSSQKGVMIESVNVPDTVKLGFISKNMELNGFIGETFFKDIVFRTIKKKHDIQIEIKNISHNEISITPKIVTSWYQSGVSTTKKKFGGALTYELLLSDDRDFILEDQWLKSNNGGWVYSPPDIKVSDVLNTVIGANFDKRILFKVTLGENVLPGNYLANLVVSSISGNETSSFKIPLNINVLPVQLTNKQNTKYKLMLYTAFKINDQPERRGAYVNAMRFHGSVNERDRLLQSYLKDIKEHGFNGITVRDWDQVNLEKTLTMAQQLGFSDVVLHSTTPVTNKHKILQNPIISSEVKNIYKKLNFQLYYYGFDEVGGNKLLKEQLQLNQDIDALGGESVNAVFWSDMPNVISEIGRDSSKCFNIVAYSMGSHGNKQMFASLPYVSKDDYCSKRGTKYLTYWHPHVENPVINRIFMGFWLWASGLDGVIPHGYYFPSHIERVISKSDIRRGTSTVTSPYDDWSYWLPGNLRHHNSVYPSRSGPIGTLQWEGVLNGYMDLRYILTLEAKLEDPNVSKYFKNEINKLLAEIRNEVLQIVGPYMNDKDSITYLKKLELWKKQITALLLN